MFLRRIIPTPLLPLLSSFTQVLIGEHGWLYLIICMNMSKNLIKKLSTKSSLTLYVSHHCFRLCLNASFDQQTGFNDTVAVIREATIKSIILLAPKVEYMTSSEKYLSVNSSVIVSSIMIFYDIWQKCSRTPNHPYERTLVS